MATRCPGPNWADHEDGGQRYKLDHLHAFFLRYHIDAVPAKGHKPGRAAKDLVIYVTFSHHCFTQAIDAEEVLGHREEERYVDTGRGEERVFCAKRWHLSKQLPTILQTLHDRRCFFAKNDNFFTVELGNVVPPEDYVVYFYTARHNTADLQLTIQSAYTRPDQPHLSKGVNKIGFNAIVMNTLRGTRPRRPPR